MTEPQVIWMEVTVDEYELPIAIADSAGDLAKMIGVRKNGIFEAMSKYKSGKCKTCRYRKVVLEDDG